MQADLSKFYAITCISNPARYQSRYRLYKKFADMVESGGVKLITVEMALGDRQFEITERDNPYHLQVRSIDELWHKENMLNLGIQYLSQLDPDAKQICWVDADIFPFMPAKEWFAETWHQLQVYEIVQMFEYAQDFGPTHNQIGPRHEGFVSAYVKSGYQLPSGYGTWKHDYNIKHGHPGFCFAANLPAISALGGLLDMAILGSADRHMMMAILGCVEQSISPDLSPGYKSVLLNWQERAQRYIKKDIGFVSGSIGHYWHGRKADRGYWDRWKILISNQFDPNTDLKKDHQGLYQLESHSPRQLLLRDQIRSYFRGRNEDTIEETTCSTKKR